MPPPRRLFACLLALLALVLSAATATPATEQLERTVAAHLLAYGRMPVAPSVSAESLDAQLTRQCTILGNDPRARTAVARAAWRDAFGYEPDAEDLRAESATAFLYHERMKNHSARLTENSPEFAAVISRAYRRVLARDAYAEEFAYWRRQGARSFVALVAGIEDWARRNQPGLMVTSGVPTAPVRSRFVTLVPLSPSVALEVRAVLQLPEEARVLANGAAGLATPGKMHLALVGSE